MKEFYKILDKVFPFLVPLGAIAGVGLGDMVAGGRPLVPWLFALVTFIGALKINFKDMKATLSRPKPILAILLILRVLMPLWALLVGRLAFPQNPLIQVGLLLYALIPVGVNSAIWVVLFGGNLALSLSVIILDTLLSPFILPLSLLVLTGTQVEMDGVGMMLSLLQMIVLPSIVGMVVNQLAQGRIPSRWTPRFGLISKLGLLAVIMINGGNVAPHFQVIDWGMIAIMGTIILLATSGYSISWLVARLGRFNEQDTVSIVFGGGMRNVSTGIVLAVSYFPPEAAIPVVTSVLFQQVICAMFAQGLKRNHQKKVLH